ncbi:SPOR domain-containing protein [Roseovarius autotrophicus]|uniref:SPOR domain-containing protein n=1 Tax=Roseovarius autotrophicus TaxID=2824121 RepID=UPI00300C7CF1
MISLALVGGIGIWGYGMVMRDVSGVPVVRALEGPMREAPEEPGGHPAAHQGLAVNRIAADGAAEPPPDQVIIAPQPLDLVAEDSPNLAPDPARVAPVARPQPADVHLAVVREEVVEPIPAPAPILVAAVSGGLGQSLRPRPRPATADPVAFALAAATGAPTGDVEPESLPIGTRLAQLGAYESAEVARAEWDRLSARLGDLLDGKSRVVQRAESGGRTFYRLRAVGFEDLADARRFCSALQAEKADCIPVVTR